MMKQKLGATSLLLAVTLITFANQDSESKSAGQSFTFRRGQAVYIAAFHRAHNTSKSHGGGSALYTISYDLNVEGRVKKEFEEERFFKIAGKLSEADFVFMVYVDGSTAEGLVLPPQKYSELKGQIDRNNQLELDALREAAYERYMVGPFRIPTLHKISDRLVKKLHKAPGTKTGS